MSFPKPGGFTDSELDSQALKWHSDWHGTSFCKLFIPLTPLNTSTGTHSFIPESHKIRPSFYADTRYENSLIELKYSPVTFNLLPGDLLIEDTSGLHKGIPGHSDYRIVLMLLVQNSFIFEGRPPSMRSLMLNQLVN